MSTIHRLLTSRYKGRVSACEPSPRPLPQRHYPLRPVRFRGSRLQRENRHSSVYCYFVYKADTPADRLHAPGVLIEGGCRSSSRTLLARADPRRLSRTHSRDSTTGSTGSWPQEAEGVNASPPTATGSAEQDRLCRHYADAIPLAVLKREQDRIVAELDKVTRRIDAHFGDYADSRPLR